MNINNNQNYSLYFTDYQSEHSDSDADSINHHMDNVENEDQSSEISDWSDDVAPLSEQINTFAMGLIPNAPLLQVQQLNLPQQPVNLLQDNHLFIGGIVGLQQPGNLPQLENQLPQINHNKPSPSS